MSTFKDLGLPDQQIKALARLQIITPTDIQTQAFPILRQRKDVWLSAPTGSGKTLAYLLPLIAEIDMSTTDLQVAIVSPTQELAVQIYDCIHSLVDPKQTPTLRSQLLIGNASAQRQKEKLKKKPHIIVGTLGRMLELGRIRKLKLHLCRSIVIDEADNMLAEDKVPDVEAFIKMTPRGRQLVFTSATQKGDAFYIAETIGKDVLWQAAAAATPMTTATIEHSFVATRYHNKGRILRKLLDSMAPDRAIIFVHRNSTAETLGDELRKHQTQLAVIHGGLNKFDRQKALNHFRRGKIKLLIASDVAARGLDVKGVTHIFNVDLPSNSDDYTHRAGRTARMGASGHTISLASEDELKLIRRYERDLHIQIQKLEVEDPESSK
jgi:superfamily II DNA/RNA helicase